MVSRMLIAAAWVVLLGIAASGVEAGKRFARAKKGIRLVGESGCRGRLEVGSSVWWLAGDSGDVAWRPICADGFTDDTAQAICIILGYKTGRTYASPEVTYSANQTDAPLSNLQCNPKDVTGGTNRRLLQRSEVTAAVATTAVAGKLPTDGVSRGGADRGADRTLYEPLSGLVDTAKRSPYECYFYVGYCGPQGDLAGVECSYQDLPPRPPAPPTLPSTPPAPPSPSESIRFVGGQSWVTPPQGSLRGPEPNLCPSPEFCGQYVRVEVQVDTPGQPGAKVWAPLCNPPAYMADGLARIACEQAYNWPDDAKPPRGTVGWNAAETAFAIPTGAVDAADSFKPDTVAGWVTVLGGDFDASKTIQGLNITVTGEPCADGAMFASFCNIIQFGGQ